MSTQRDDARAALVELLRQGQRLRMGGEKVIAVWNGPRDEALAGRLRAAKPGLREMLLPLVDPSAAATKMLNATIIG